MQAVQIVAERQPAADSFFLTRTGVARVLGHEGPSEMMRSFVRRLEGTELHPEKRGGVWRFRRSEVEALARRPDFAHSKRLTAAELEQRIIESLKRNNENAVIVAGECSVTIETVIAVRRLVHAEEERAAQREKQENSP